MTKIKSRLNVKDLSRAKEEEDPFQITCSAVKREHDVSCTSIVLVGIGHRHSGLHSTCLSDFLTARSNRTVVNGLQRGAQILCN